MTAGKHTPEIRKFGDRFYANHWTHVMVYAADGTYLGQYEDDTMEEGPIFIGPDPKRPVKPLSAEQIRAAISKAQENHDAARS